MKTVTLIFGLALTSSAFALEIDASTYEDSAGRKITIEQKFYGELMETSERSGVKHYSPNFHLASPTHHQILFVGGDGSYRCKDEAILTAFQLGPNFLTRTRLDYVKAGASVTVFCAPSDRYGGKWLYKSFSKPNYRTSNEFLTDLKSLIGQLKAKFDIPVWLNGTSAGSYAAVFGATNLPELVDGVVISSIVTETSSVMPEAIEEIGLLELSQPLLVMMHSEDVCKATPPQRAKKVFEKASAIDKAFVLIEGGGKPKSKKACKYYAKHGFYGSEEDAVSTTMAFINGRL